MFFIYVLIQKEDVEMKNKLFKWQRKTNEKIEWLSCGIA